MNLVLIGYRGTGKTTIAQRLALRLGWHWIDADVEIELRAAKSIKTIFDDDGEPRFRQLESDVLRDLRNRNQTVIAAGGGAVLRPENRVVLGELGPVIWLTASLETIVARVAADPSTAGRRPNLTTRGGRAEIEQLLAIRTPLYEQCADLTVATDDRSPDQIAAEIIALLDLKPDARSAP